MTPLDTVSGQDDIEPGAYNVKLIETEEGSGKNGNFMFWKYEIFNSNNNIIKEIRRITSLSTTPGSKVYKDCLALGLDLKTNKGMTSNEIISAVVGKYAVGNVIINENGYASIESLSKLQSKETPQSTPVPTQPPVAEETLPF